jgi:hypothetical protein
MPRQWQRFMGNDGHQRDLAQIDNLITSLAGRKFYRG